MNHSAGTTASSALIAPALPKMFDFIGLTDEVTDCGLCGKPNLKRTVILRPLDEDGGTDGEEHYYGTACAAMALGWSHGAGDPQHRRASARVLREAHAAESERAQARAHAWERIQFWGPFEHADPVALWALWRTRNPYDTTTDPRVEIPATVADARVVLGLTPFAPDVPVWAAAYLDWYEECQYEQAIAPAADIHQGFRDRAADRARHALAAAALCTFDPASRS